MDDRQILQQLKERQAGLASSLSALVLEMAQTRAITQAVFITQGKILLLLGRSEEQVKADMQEAITLSVSQGLAHVSDSLLVKFEEISNRSEPKNPDPA